MVSVSEKPYIEVFNSGLLDECDIPRFLLVIDAARQEHVASEGLRRAEF